MKAMILAAGLGKRMRPLTDTLPKPLIPVRGKRLIEWHLEALARAGITQVIINLAYRGEQIKAFVGDGSAWGLQVVYSQEPEPLETGGAIVHAAELLGNEPFILLNADIFTDFDFASLVNLALAEGALGYLVLVPNPAFKAIGDFGLQGALVQTLTSDRAGYTFSGISVLEPALVTSYPYGRRLFPLAEAFCWAIEQNRLEGGVYTGLWNDVGTPVRYQDVNEGY